MGYRNHIRQTQKPSKQRIRLEFFVAEESGLARHSDTTISVADNSDYNFIKCLLSIDDD